jgi:hypothetical protein
MTFSLKIRMRMVGVIKSRRCRQTDCLFKGVGLAGVRTQARDTGKSGLEGLLFARSYPWVNGVGTNGTIGALISNERISQTVATKPTNTFMAMVSTIGTTVFLAVRAFYPAVNIGCH